MSEQETDPFRDAFRGRFENVLRWEQLDALWEVLRADAGNGWHIYAVGEPPPVQPVRGCNRSHLFNRPFLLIGQEIIDCLLRVSRNRFKA